MPQQESLVLKIATFLITENKLSFHSAFSVETVFQGIPTVLVPKGKLYLTEKMLHF